ncbi:thiol reductant ABC exporter subunit CydD [Tistrella mobilis]|uniref:ABC transporter, CydDC cysteine exporter (CydDC-E) family, permease/ATP-binding protein CydD n=1 Tax=Tistrella mobilis (strain KA081020-065) TaxID=1110502 RepID=I3TS56_TISMK|nr:thiol reductant ABC exporter subunit CydD [Tistrella mobilis]AFK55594.1 ABC transporter, CydDC cysteine exporter (CydDC-E) family, permease/ATP-binding protein CydD [Tistrella mobilis KA081020-065]
MQLAAALVWLPMAWIIARTLGQLADDAGTAAVLPAALAVLALGLLRAGLEALGTRMVFRAARAEVGQLRRQALAALAARDPLDPGRTASGAAASVVAEQAEAVLPWLHRYRPVQLKVVTVPFVLLVAVASISWAAALILLVAAPLIPVFMALVGIRAKAASEAQLAELGTMNAVLMDRLRGLSTIRALDAVEVTAGRLRAAAESVRQRTMAVLRIAFLSSAVLELFSALGVAMVAVYVGFHLLGDLNFGAWGGRMGLAQGLFVLLLAPAFFEPLRELAAVWHDRASGEAAHDALMALGTAPAADPAPAPSPAEATISGPPSLSLQGLSFTHPASGRGIPQGFSLEVAPGERVALFGPSGSGKSTLLALIAGLALPDGGRIIIGGTPLDASTRADLRRRIAWIGHRPHMIAGSLMANVRFGRAVEAGPPLARLLPGVDPARQVGEAGFGLSGGEAVRLAIARAIADPAADIVLADEPTAHLDGDTAARVRTALIEATAGRTLVVATHDPDLAAALDRVIRLEGAA